LQWIELRENGQQVPSQIEQPINEKLTMPPSF
jgi:hypothetical protein